jgi:hypothetical protein
VVKDNLNYKVLACRNAKFFRLSFHSRSLLIHEEQQKLGSHFKSNEPTFYHGAAGHACFAWFNSHAVVADIQEVGTQQSEI